MLFSSQKICCLPWQALYSHSSESLRKISKSGRRQVWESQRKGKEGACHWVVFYVWPHSHVNRNRDMWHKDVKMWVRKEVGFESSAMVHTSYTIILWFIYSVGINWTHSHVPGASCWDHYVKQDRHGCSPNRDRC